MGMYYYLDAKVLIISSDGTVPLMSLGYVCAPSGPWRKHADLYNPGNSSVIIREYQNEAIFNTYDFRGGNKASDHVDILGNWEMTVSLFMLKKYL